MTTIPKSFLDLAELSSEQVNALVASAQELRESAPLDIAAGKTLGLLFLNPSLRTRVSMIGAWAHLGGDCVDLTPGQGMWALAEDDQPMLGAAAEHIEEASGVLGRLCDVLGVRAFANGSVWAEDRQDRLIRTFAEFADCPFINMESGMYHPCQALADRVTLEDHGITQGEDFVLSWAYHPKALPQAVGNSALLMAAQAGLNVTLLRPDGYQLDSEVMSRAESLAKANAGSICESDDRACLKSTRVVYVKSWGSLAHYENPSAEAELRSRHQDWCIGGPDSPVGEETSLMHCLPVRRDVVVSTDLLKSKRSLVLDEAENRKWAQCALLKAHICSQ